MANATYLRLFPAVKQFELKNGALNVGGRLFVYYEGTDDLAEIRDENGTVLQQPAILDNDGRALGLFVDAQRVYRLVVQDASGAMQFTVSKMAPSGGGAGSALGKNYNVTSTDGSITVNKFDDAGTTVFDLGLDVDMDQLNPSCLKAGAAPKTGDGKFVFEELVREGDLLSVDEHGAVRCEQAWYHFTAIVELAYDGTATNASHQITLYTTLSNSVVDFDISYAHRESIELSGDIHVVESNNEFVLGVTGLPNGVVASLVDFDIHAITGHEQSNEYTAGNGIDIADHVISADLDVVQHKLTAGTNITITNNVISAESLTQEQADWNQTDNTQPDYIKNKPDLSVYATTSAMETALAGKQDVISDLSTIRSGAAAGATAVQPASLNTALAAKQDVISDLATIRSGAALGATSVQPNDLATVATTGDYDNLTNKPDLSVYATTSAMNTALAGKQDTISDLSTIRSGASLGASSVQPGDLATVATTGSYNDLSDKPSIPAAQVNSDWDASSGVAAILNKPSLATVATTGDYDDLSNKPSIPAAQVNSDWNSSSGVSEILNKPANLVQDANYVHTDENFTSAEKTKLAGIAAGAEVNVQADWTESDSSSDAYIQNKPSLATVATTGAYSDLSGTPSLPTATSDLTNDSGFITALDIPAQVQANWNETDNTDPSYIQNKPTIPAAQVNADWNSSSGVSEILNKPSLATVATTGAYSDLSGIPTIPTATSDLTNDSGFITSADIPAQAQADWTESDSSDPSYIQNKPSLATVATTGAYSDLSGKPTIPTVDQTYNASSTNAQSGVAVAQAIAAAPGATYSAGDGIDIDANDEISVKYDASTLEIGRSYTPDQTLSTIDSYYPYALQTNSVVSDWIADGVSGETLRIKIPANMFRFSSGATVHIAIGNSPASNLASDWCYYSGVNISLIGDGAFSFYVAEQTIEIPLPLDASGWVGNVPTTNQLAITFVSINNGGIIEYANNAGIGSLLVARGVAGMLMVKNPLPGSASADASKVLTVDSNGDPAWTAPASATVDQTYNASSTNAQSGTAVAGAISGVNQVPASTSSDADKVLTVNSSGTPVWATAQAPISAGTGIDITNNVVSVNNTVAMKSDLPTATSDLTNDSGFITSADIPAQVNADWNSSSGASEILNKPTIPSGTQLVPASTSSDADKVLTVNAQGVPGWATAQAPISAGNGIDITNNVVSVDTSVVATQTDMASKEDAFDVGTGLEMDTSGATPTLQVEAPVDIVAGPGIVIDNPDGNTLRVSVAQAEEVVLYDAGDSPSQAGPWQISEDRTNFEWLDIVFGNNTTGSMKQVTRFAADSKYMKLHLPRYDEEPSYKWTTMTLTWNNTTASIRTNSVGRFTIASNGSVSVSTTAEQAPYLFQIVGVHRINGGN